MTVLNPAAVLLSYSGPRVAARRSPARPGRPESLPATMSGDVVRADRMTVTRADGSVYLDESVAGFGTDARRSAAAHHVAANRSVRFYRTGSPAAYFRTRDRVVPAR